jgi:hypothetical protein
VTLWTHKIAFIGTNWKCKIHLVKISVEITTRRRLDTDGRIRGDLEKYDFTMYTGFIWLRKGSIGKFL